MGPNDQSAGDEIAVRYSSLQEAAASIDRQAGRLRGDLEDIRQAVHRVTANWEGEAQTQYNTMQHQWNKKADHIQNILVTSPTRSGRRAVTTTRRTRGLPATSETQPAEQLFEAWACAGGAHAVCMFDGRASKQLASRSCVLKDAALKAGLTVWRDCPCASAVDPVGGRRRRHGAGTSGWSVSESPPRVGHAVAVPRRSAKGRAVCPCRRSR